MAVEQPRGTERIVVNHKGVAIDGAPIAYIVVLASVVTALAFIPFSIQLGLGGSFPMYQGILGLIGWVLGPIAGAITSGVGALIGAFIAPHTSAVWFVSVIGAGVASFAAGTMRADKNKRKYWWIGVTLLTLVAMSVYLGRAIFVNGIALQWAILASFVNWSALLLFIFPTRTLVAKWIASDKISQIAAGLALGTWICYGLAHTFQSAITYTMFNWPEEIWVGLSTIIPIEFIARAGIAAVIGTGVIVGLRAIGLVKPTEAVY